MTSADPNPSSQPPVVGDEARLLAAVAEMAAGAAHEINNPLAVISGRAQLMAERAPDDTDRKTWQQMAEQAQRISDIISDLMRFASPERPEICPIKTGKLVEDASPSVFFPKSPNAKASKFDKKVVRDCPDLLVDPAQIHLVLRALLDNAFQARPEGAHVLLTAEPSDDKVLLRVRDNGPGMDADTLTRAFTPFFSAQRAGRRRGLGLPMAWRYVVNNHGRIWIESQLGHGTDVHVLLPAAN